MFVVQQASSWALGDSFVFVDILEDGGADGFNDKNFYGEWYPTLSLGKLSNRVGRARFPRTAPAPPPRLLTAVSKRFRVASRSRVLRFKGFVQ